MITKLHKTPVAITGAAGFIGSHLAKRLVKLGARVTCLIKPEESLWRLDDIKDKTQIVRVDILDRRLLTQVFKKTKPKKIFHCAASVATAQTPGNIEELLSVNLKGTMCLLDSLQDVAFDCFINTGSSEEYGIGDTPYREEQREMPVSMYAVTKVCATHYCSSLWRMHKIPVVNIRPTIAYGPFQTADVFLPTLIKKCLTGEWFKMTKGNQARDFIFVDDIVDGFLKASITKKAAGEIINLASGTEYVLKDVVNLVAALTGSKKCHKIGALPYQAHERMHSYASNEKAKRLLQWKPTVDLVTGLKRTIAWYRSHI